VNTLLIMGGIIGGPITLSGDIMGRTIMLRAMTMDMPTDMPADMSTMAVFNDGARAQWSIAYRRWQYEYAAWQQTRGPAGIFAAFGGRFGGPYGSRYGTGCDCEQ
jgi:hypothetical protein